jgi:hypothetical protein
MRDYFKLPARNWVSRACGAGQHIVRNAFFLHQALVQKDQVVGHLTRKAHFVGHHNHSAALERQGPHDPKHLGHQFRARTGAPAG